MHTIELDGHTGLGAAAHAAGRSYFRNPMLVTGAPVDIIEQWRDWEALCRAWSAGWMQADGGRDQAMRVLGRVRYL